MLAAAKNIGLHMTDKSNMKLGYGAILRASREAQDLFATKTQEDADR